VVVEIKGERALSFVRSVSVFRGRKEYKMTKSLVADIKG
jgi:hypothetical protein